MRSTGGFTLMELMVVVVILGTVLLLVPTNLTGFGAHTRLMDAANNVSASMTGAREQAIIDGYETHIEFGYFKQEDGPKLLGHRFKFTSVPQAMEGSDDNEQAEQRREMRSAEREWMYSTWHPLPDGVTIGGVSEDQGQWRKIGESKPYIVTFHADGNVDKAVAIRLVSESLKEDGASTEGATITVQINALTSEPSWKKGEHELPRTRPASDFGR